MAGQQTGVAIHVHGMWLNSTAVRGFCSLLLKKHLFMMKFCLLLFTLCNFTIAIAGMFEGHANSKDSSKLHIQIVENKFACNPPHLMQNLFFFELISDNGSSRIFTLKNKDSILKIPSVYSIIAVPVPGFIYGRKCYYKIDGKKTNVLTIENNVPLMKYGNDVKNSIYDFWNLFYKQCPYFNTNRILFETNLNIEGNKRQLYNLRKTVYHLALSLLDTLKNSMEASNSTDYFFLKNILRYEWLGDCLLASQQVKTFYNSDPEFNKEIRMFEISKNDELINLPVYQQFLQNYLERVLLDDKRFHINAHGFTYRYYEAIDKINRLPASLSKQYLATYCLQKTEENFDTKTIEIALSKMKAWKDTAVMNLIKKIKHRIELRNQLQKNKNEFVTIDLKLYSLQNIINMNRGKVLYVDIWASWCVPCRNAMPYSLKLREYFRDKNIAFIYFSVDEDFDKWKVATEQENLTFYPYSYKAANPKDNSFLLSINNDAIPRYLIFDQNGKLAHTHAPGPDSGEIKSLLQSFFKKF